ncbi:hypothetical protein [uncultured Maribacter sp.]|uniref:hypothetical protein n=1 Tax=uncultured Maribacter sp. TaxID=431308 RepID=UPI00262ACB75|nr:hypothetical protein [uncultured Maribacter sp.]
MVSTFGKYFHFFWIPIIPLFKTHVAECSHCKISYSKFQFTPEMNAALQKENDINPVKRPIWHGCGCIILVSFFAVVLSISFYGVYQRANNPEASNVEKDPRKKLLANDLDKLSSILLKSKDSVSIALKQCVTYDIESGIDTKKIEYFSKVNEDKILVLLRIKDLKNISAKERKVIIDIVEDCLKVIPYHNHIQKQYIGVEGKWNTVLVKTPTDSDLGGRFADKNKLLSFYDKTKIPLDSLK